MDIGRFLQNTSAMGASWARDARKPRVETHEVPLTLSRIATLREALAFGDQDMVMDVSPSAYAEIALNMSGLRRYTSDRYDMSDGSIAYYSSNGKITLRADASLQPGQHRWHRAAITTASPTGVMSCSYCGAPGQIIGARCEYCQVAVSR